MKNIYNIVFILILQSTIINQQSFSQTAPGIEWQNTIGGIDDDRLYSIEQTSDGGYICGGWSASNISGDKIENNLGPMNTDDYWIIKLDVSGNIEWQNTIGGSDNDRLYSIEQTSDGGYILGGYSESNISGDKTENCMGQWDYWIVKTDSMGNIQWQNTIGGSDDDYLRSIKKTTDGGYILGGYSWSDISGDKTENSNGSYDYWIVKINASGSIQWQNTIGGEDLDQLYSIRQTADGGYILGGSSGSDISGDKTEDPIGINDYWIVKTDSLGYIQWQNTIGGNSWDYLYSIQQTSDAGYFLGGYSWSNISGDKTENCLNNTYDYWIVKTDSLGNIQWENTIGGYDVDYLYSIQQTVDGGYVLGGLSWSDVSGDKTENSLGAYDIWILKTDFSGNIQWQNSIGGDEGDWLYSLRQTADGGYFLGGLSNSNISGEKTENSWNYSLDYWIIKLFPDTITGMSNPQSTIRNPQFFPNPLITQSKLTFKNSSNEKFIFTLYDITGRVVESVSTTAEQIILTKDRKQPGVYLFNLINEKTGERWNGKIIIAD